MQQFGNLLMPINLSSKTMPHSSSYHRHSSTSPRKAKTQSIYHVLSTLKRTKTASLEPLVADYPVTTSRGEYTPMKLIEKLVENLPTEPRCNILEIARLISSSEITLKKICDKQSAELLLLQSAHDKKNAELHTALHECEVHRRLSADMRDFKGNQADSLIKRNDRKTVKSNFLISKLTGPNPVIIDTLHINQPTELKAIKQFEKRRDSNTLDSTIEESADEEDYDGLGLRSESASSIMPTSSRSITSSASGTSTYHRKRSILFNLSDDVNCPNRISIDPSMKDAKLRNSLLVMSREKYRMTKKVEVLGDEVDILKTKLEISELKCRHLQIDLAGVKGADDAAPYALTLIGKSPPSVKTKDFGPVDELFKVLSPMFL